MEKTTVKKGAKLQKATGSKAVKSKKSTWIDITLPIYPGMIAGPSDPPVVFKLWRDPAKGDRVTMALTTMITHTGTHIDAPRHFFVDGTTVDELPIETFIGPARVIEIKDADSIKPEELEKYDIKAGERLLFKTKNSALYKSEKYTTPHVYFTNEAARFLVTKKVLLIGIDYITVGPYNSPQDNDYLHKLFLKGGVSILEEYDLTGVTPGLYELIALPIRLRERDAATCRAVIRPL